MKHPMVYALGMAQSTSIHYSREGHARKEVTLMGTSITLSKKHPLARLLLKVAPKGSDLLDSTGSTAAAQSEMRLQVPGYGTVAYCKLVGGSLYLGHREHGLPSSKDPGALLIAPGSSEVAARKVVAALLKFEDARRKAAKTTTPATVKARAKIKAGHVPAKVKVRRRRK